MPYRAGDRVIVTEDVTVEILDYTARFPAGLVLTVLAVRGQDIRVPDVDTAGEVWIPERLVRVTT